MSVVRWDPLREISELQRSIHQLFDGRAAPETGPVGFPVDVYETPEAVVVRADLPGVRAEDIQVQHHDGALYIRANRASEAPDGAVWLVRQAPGGDLLRAFTLGVPVDLDSVAAHVEDGVLELRLPKAQHARPREIPIQAGSRRRPGGAAEPRKPQAPQA